MYRPDDPPLNYPLAVDASPAEVQAFLKLDLNKPSRSEQFRRDFRSAYAQGLTDNSYKLPVVDYKATFRTPLKHGWLVGQLQDIEELAWGRWDHWFRTKLNGGILTEKIPQIEWVSLGSPQYRAGHKAITHALDTTFNHLGGYCSWGSWSMFDYFLDWLLFGLGHAGQKTEPKEPSPGTSALLYQSFDLAQLILYPYDYFGEILAENAFGRQLNFYPTPMSIADFMARMTMDNGEDHRGGKMMDPCTGTGRFPMVASNYCYNLYAMDINLTVLKACIINLFLYAPWGIRPFDFLDRHLCNPCTSRAISDFMVETAMTQGPDVQEYLANTEHDFQLQSNFEPVKIRRKISQKAHVRMPIPDPKKQLAFFE